MIDGRLTAAGAIQRLLQRGGDAIQIDPDIVGTTVDPVNSI